MVRVDCLLDLHPSIDHRIYIQWKRLGGWCPSNPWYVFVHRMRSHYYQQFQCSIQELTSDINKSRRAFDYGGARTTDDG